MKKTGAERLDRSSESTAEQPAQGDLLPCPFCGEPPSEYVNFTWNIECLANEASCNRAYVYADTKEEVRKLWNTRADLQPEPDTVRISKYQFEMSKQLSASIVSGLITERARQKAEELFDSLVALEKSE